MALPRSDADRIAKYNAKTASTTVGLKVAARLPGMKTDFESFAEDFAAMQMQVRAELGTVATVFPISYGLYQAYAAELWKLKQTATGAVVDAAAQVVKTKWTTRGGTSAVLIAIALNVFGIVVT
jgi:hypothetical protein